MSNNQFDILEVAARMEMNGIDDVVNVFQFRLDTPGTINNLGVANDLIKILEDVYTILNVGISLLQLYRDLRITNLTQSTVLGTYAWATLTAGIAADDPTPNGVSGLVNYATGVPRVAPRKYYGVFTEVSVDSSGYWTPGWTSALAAAGAQLLGPQPSILGTYTYGYLSPKTLAFQPATSVIATNVPAYQRRRKPGRGA